MTNANINLYPGELLFSTDAASIQTTLGSCVALTVWHPSLKIGGMCHFLMPKPKKGLTSSNNDFRYGLYALDQLLHDMKFKAPAEEYILGLFGGSRMFTTSQSDSIGQDNINFANQWLSQHNLLLSYKDISGECSRSLVLNLTNGEIKVRIYQASEQELTHGN